MKVAQNLYNYFKSFDISGGSTTHMNVPVQAIDKWFEKFQNKHKLDPNFVFKSTE